MPELTRRKLLEYWWTLPVAGTLGALGVMGNYARRVLFGKQRAGPPRFVAGERLSVARLDQLPGVYSTVEFSYGGTPCVLMRLPQATPSSLSVKGQHFAAWSRICTHLGCAVNLLSDPEVTALTYNYRPQHPMLGCPCHFSVFDPSQQGESVFGRALYPLPRVKLEARGGELLATGIESPPGPAPG